MANATVFLEQVALLQADPGDPGFWREFLMGMLKPVASTAVVAMAVALSFTQGLGIEGEMVYGIARSFLQLSVIGFVLQFIFTHKNAVFCCILAYLFMVYISAALLFVMISVICLLWTCQDFVFLTNAIN